MRRHGGQEGRSSEPGSYDENFPFHSRGGMTGELCAEDFHEGVLKMQLHTGAELAGGSGNASQRRQDE